VIKIFLFNIFLSNGCCDRYFCFIVFIFILMSLICWN